MKNGVQQPPGQNARPVALTIAGSDSGGGAGIQADLQMFAAAGVFGTCAITCLTAQNPGAVTAIRAVDAAMVTEQISAVRAAFPVRAAKTGMLYNAEIIAAVANAMKRTAPHLVVDPVMVAGSGARLLLDEAVAALRAQLLPLATVVTPNIPEAEILAGFAITGADDQRRAASVIAGRWNTACVVKGGHLPGGDTLGNAVAWDGRVVMQQVSRVQGGKTHGTGCTFAAALTAALALGADIPRAAAWAAAAVVAALTGRPTAGAHFPLNWKAVAPFIAGPDQETGNPA